MASLFAIGNMYVDACHNFDKRGKGTTIAVALKAKTPQRRGFGNLVIMYVLLPAIVRRFLGNFNIVGVAFAHTRIGNFYKSGFLQGSNIWCAAIPHTGP